MSRQNIQKSQPSSIEDFLDRLDGMLHELVIEAVRHGIPKSQVEYIYDVRMKTIESIKKSLERKNR